MKKGGFLFGEFPRNVRIVYHKKKEKNSKIGKRFVNSVL